MKKVVSLILISLLVIGVLSACGDKGSSTPNTPQGDGGQGKQSATADNVNPPGEFPICKEEINIRIGVVQNANVEDFETNKLTEWYEEKGNFKLQFEIYPDKDAQQKLEVEVSSGGELPEALIGFNITDEAILNYGTEGALIPLNDYYDNWSYYIDEAFGKVANKDLKEWLTSADGNMYYIPKNNEQIGNMYSMRTWINKNWLDTLKLEMPKTTEDFKNVVDAFINQDPNGNGKKDEIGIIGGTGWRALPADFILNAFIYDDTNNRFIVENGNLDVAFNKKEWQDGLRYLNELTEEGLFLPQSFTMDDAQMRQMIESGDVSQVGVITHGNPGNIFGATNERKLEYVPLPPLTGPEGKSYSAFFPDIPQKNFLITKDAKNPEAIFRWADLMCSEEGIMRTRWGIPDVDWKEPGPDDKSLLDSIGFEAKMVPILPWGSVQNSHWAFITAGIVPMGVADGQVAPKDDPLYSEIWIAQAVPFYKDKEAKERADILKFTLEEAEELKELKTTINTYVKESIALFTVGEKDIDKDWDEYCKELENMGLERYLEISQSGYDRANPK